MSVEFYIFNNLQSDGVTEWAYLSTVQRHTISDTSSLASMVGDSSDPRTFAMVIASQGALANNFQRIMPYTIDLTDKNGNGFLIATDSLNFTVGCAAGAAAVDAVCKILYRMVDVGIEEYVGIVQSQVAGGSVGTN